MKLQKKRLWNCLTMGIKLNVLIMSTIVVIITTNEEKLSKALQDFKTKYPSITSADLQTFVLGWQEAVKNCFIPVIISRICLIIN